jgi:hypothetical protein
VVTNYCDIAIVPIDVLKLVLRTFGDRNHDVSFADGLPESFATSVFGRRQKFRGKHPACGDFGATPVR